MMEKELAQATKLAEQANKKVAQLKKKMLAELSFTKVQNIHVLA